MSFLSSRRVLVHNGETFEFFIMDLLRVSFPGAVLLHDLKVYSTFLGKDTQIDVVLVLPNGVFAIEAKNWKHWVSGEYGDFHWTGKSRDNKIMQVFNPIHQNFIHVRALRNAMRNTGFSPVFFHSFVVVPDGTQIKSSCKEVVSVTALISRMREVIATSNDSIDVAAYSKCISEVCAVS